MCIRHKVNSNTLCNRTSMYYCHTALSWLSLHILWYSIIKDSIYLYKLTNNIQWLDSMFPDIL